MRGEEPRARRWVGVLAAFGAVAVVPVLLASGVALAFLGVLLDEPVQAASGAAVATLAALLERRRVGALDDRMVRMRTRLRLTRSKADAELADLRLHVRALDLQLWEYRLLDQMPPQARTLTSGTAATLARPYADQTVQYQAVGELEAQEWDLFKTHPIELAGIRPPGVPEVASPLPAVERALGSDVEPALGSAVEIVPPVTAPRPSLPLHPEPPTIELPVVRPGEGARVIDLRSRPAEGVAPEDAAELDELVYRQLAEADPTDELTATMEPGRRVATAAGAGTAVLPDDPGRRTA